MVLLIFSLSLCDILDPTTTTTTAATTTTSKLILSKSTIHVQPNIINIIRIQMLGHFTHSLLDPCKGVTCATGKKAVASLGICQCLEVKFIMENVPFQIFIVRYKKVLSHFRNHQFSALHSQCTASSDCTGTTSNQCVGGQCKCGTSDKCSSVTPFCGKTSAKSTAATATDGNSAACYVSEYFLLYII